MTTTECIQALEDARLLRSARDVRLAASGTGSLDEAIGAAQTAAIDLLGRCSRADWRPVAAAVDACAAWSPEAAHAL